MKSLVFLANSKAGRGSKVGNLLRQGQKTLWGWPIQVKLPSTAAKALDVCRRLDPEKTEAVFIFGGDGTLNQVLPALLQSKIPVCPIPAGTANDLAKKLGISLDWELIQLLVDKRGFESIDIVEVNGKPFATIGGIGVGAFLTKKFNELRTQSTAFRVATKKLKSQVYTWMSVHTILTRKDYIHDIRVTAPNFHERLETGALFICNQTGLGGDMTVAARALNDDEKFDVFILPRMGKTQMLKALTSLKEGRAPSGAIQFSTDNLLIEDMDDRKILVFGDGEFLTQNSKLEFKVRPRALPIYSQSRLREVIQ